MSEFKRLFQYNELCEESKKIARQWWVDCEYEDPSWMKEHFDSCHAAIRAIENCTLNELISTSIHCVFTGYWADGLLADYIREYQINRKEDIELSTLRQYYQQEWDKELEERCSNREAIEEEIMANEYTFSSYGDRRG
jgi:hypothetical protein